jgi:hypothetical protein
MQEIGDAATGALHRAQVMHLATRRQSGETQQQQKNEKGSRWMKEQCETSETIKLTNDASEREAMMKRVLVTNRRRRRRRKSKRDERRPIAHCSNSWCLRPSSRTRDRWSPAALSRPMQQEHSTWEQQSTNT